VINRAGIAYSRPRQPDSGIVGRRLTIGAAGQQPPNIQSVFPPRPARVSELADVDAHAVDAPLVEAGQFGIDARRRDLAIPPWMQNLR